MSAEIEVELPNPFRFENGQDVRTAKDWCRRREVLRELIVGIEYGGLPPTPASVEAEELHTSSVRSAPGTRFISYRIHTGPDGPFSFLLYLHVPQGDGPFPVVLTGDSCWRYATDEIVEEVLRRGNVLAQFNRVEIAPDAGRPDRASELYLAHPEGHYGALAAWAWGYHRCVDVLSKMAFVDPARIAIVGHSRGGKTTLLAGATDDRIALVSANDSGNGGAGCFRWQGPKCEKIADSTARHTYWYGPELRTYVDRVAELPFDQHMLKALVAPRALLTTEALGDLWANPSGTWQTHRAAREVYRFLGAEERIGIWYREGEHNHGPADWRAFLEFMDWHFRGRAPNCPFDANPFPDLPPAFSWSAPRKS